MATSQVTIDPTRPLQVNFISTSPHVVVYRLWKRVAAEQPWVRVRDGSSDDDVPDFVEVPALPSGALVAWWLGIGGKPRSKYRAVVTLGQDGQVLAGGTFVEEGMTDGQGFAVADRTVALV